MSIFFTNNSVSTKWEKFIKFSKNRYSFKTQYINEQVDEKYFDKYFQSNKKLKLLNKKITISYLLFKIEPLLIKLLF